MESVSPFCLCVAGGSGSGKTTLARGLASRFHIKNWISPDGMADGQQSAQVENAFAVGRALRVRYAIDLADFGFETAFSHESNVSFLRSLKLAGYEVNLYFVSTSDPVINGHRVGNRAYLGGHSISADKVAARYLRALQNLSSATKFCDRIVVFENSLVGDVGVICDLRNDSQTKRRSVESVKTPPEWVRQYALNPFLEASSDGFVFRAIASTDRPARQHLFESFLIDLARASARVGERGTDK
jgi:predicted ABC-type ATPase